MATEQTSTDIATPDDVALFAQVSPKELAVQKAEERLAGLPYRVHLHVEPATDGKPLAIGPGDGVGPGYGTLMQSAFGSSSTDFIEEQLKHMVNAAGLDQAGLNAAVATMAAIAPADEYEASIAVQIVTSQAASQRLLTRACSANTVQAMTTIGNLASKLQRTQLAACETLLKLRTGGTQTVKHVHVTVNDNGQAVVADNVTHGGAGNAK